MEELNHNFQQKISIIHKDIDAAFSKYLQANTNVNTLRGWSLTVSLAYFGFLISIQSGIYTLFIPYLIFLFLFMYLEAIERDKSKDASDELRLIKGIFKVNDLEELQSEVSKYEFRDFRVQNRPTLSLKRIWKRFKLIFYLDSFLWYLIQLTLIFACLYFIQSGFLKIE